MAHPHLFESDEEYGLLALLPAQSSSWSRRAAISSLKHVRLGGKANQASGAEFRSVDSSPTPFNTLGTLGHAITFDI